MFQSVKVAAKTAAKVLVLGHFKGEELDKSSRALDADQSIAAALKRGEATGDAGSITEAFPSSGKFQRIIIVGLGAKDTFEVATLRTAAAAVARRLSAAKEDSANINLAGPLKARRIKPDVAGVAFGEGLGLAGWTADEFKGAGSTKTERKPLIVRSDDAQFHKGMEFGLALAAGANDARTLSNCPPNICTPDYIADQTRKLAKDLGLKHRVWKGDDLEKERFTGLINVGKASENGPCLIRLEYTPSRPRKGAKPIVLVGKTMTYDSGGLSLKINNGMKGMKRDKDGGCGVIGAMRIIAETIKPDRPVVALLAAAENSISDEAYRPDDIITFRNGVTVEVTNTDAEGRLVLADALCWACEKEDPGAVIDIATLTGGIVIALGKVYAGMFCEDDRLRGVVEKAAAATGERVWRLPLHSDYRDMMKSPIADILNSSPSREAHPVQGAAFLSYFVEKGIPWCHLDIAGVHALDSASGPFAAGPTGYGARLLARAVEMM